MSEFKIEVGEGFTGISARSEAEFFTAIKAVRDGRVHVDSVYYHGSNFLEWDYGCRWYTSEGSKPSEFSIIPLPAWVLEG
jgi:hypothetical protein